MENEINRDANSSAPEAQIFPTDTAAPPVGASAESRPFQAEIQQLLNLMIHSLYSHPEVFLRELISNSSDAIDKLKFESLTQSNLTKEGWAGSVHLIADAKNKRLVLQDNGIGMSFDEVIQNIGTIARSGTKNWLQHQKELSANPELIGQFGVGFYSVFMVAHKVHLHTQKAGENDGTLWVSTGDGSYQTQKVPRPGGHGTTITLELKPEFAGEAKKTDDAPKIDSDGHVKTPDNFTNISFLESLVQKHSDFISFPIDVRNSDQAETDAKISNSQKALWRKSPSEITAEEYSEFYKHLTHLWDEPFKTIHYRAEGTFEFTSLLFIPSQRPFDLDSRERTFGLSLYAKRVFVMANCRDILPEYLRFVRGLVDSNDLSLNVSREMLQQDEHVRVIKRSVTNKVISTLNDLKNKDRAQYEVFWKNFGSVLKEGIVMEPNTSEKLAELCLFHSVKENKWISLDEYVAARGSDQKDIFFVVGQDEALLKRSALVEKAKQKSVDVLLLTDPVDEWVVQNFRQFKGSDLKNLAKEDTSILTETEQKEVETKLTSKTEEFKDLLATITASLAAQVKEVRLTDRLVTAPAVLVSGKYDLSPQMEKLMKAMKGEEGGDAFSSKRILELNPEHQILQRMRALPEAEQKDWSELLYFQAILEEGGTIPDPARLQSLIAGLMIK